MQKLIVAFRNSAQRLKDDGAIPSKLIVELERPANLLLIMHSLGGELV